MNDKTLEPVAGILLAGGQARRMGGGDKCLLTLGGVTLLELVRDRLTPQVSAMALNANGDPSRFGDYGLPVFADSVEGFAGPLAGVLSGMIWARANAPEARFIVTAATDTPFFPENLVASLLAVSDGAYPVIALASSGDRVHPVFGLWPVALAEDLDGALRSGVRKVLDWTGGHDQRKAEFAYYDFDGEQMDPFFNVNRPEDLQYAEQWMDRLKV